jgi:hypothetical protein
VKQVLRKRPQRPIYFVVVRACDPKTGEEFGALRPMNRADERAMRERKYTVGTEVRAELKKPRNVQFHRLTHALGAYIAENVKGFEGIDAHGALKKLQAESGAECDVVTYDIPNVGKIIRNEPRSLAFDALDEGRFQEAVKTMYLHLHDHYEIDPPTLEELGMIYEVQH